MFTLKHKFQSPQADGVDPTLVKPSDWNNDHDVTASTDGVMIGRPVGAGPGPMQEVPFGSLMPTGVVVPYAGASAPAGWLICGGQIVNVSDYPTLFGILGGRYGGNGTTTFGIPDMWGRVPAGQDAGTNRITSIGGGALGAAGGGQNQAASTFGDVSVSVNPSAPLTGAINPPSGSAGAGSGAGDRFASIDTGVSITGGTMTGTIVNNGNNHTGTFTIVQPTLLLNYIIKT